MDTYFHGTAKRFDVFDPTYIGEGEICQKYGWGMYLVRSPDTADGYRDRVASLWPGHAITYTLGDLRFDERDPRSSQLFKFARDNDRSVLKDPQILETVGTTPLEVNRGLILEVQGPDFESLPDWDDSIDHYWACARAIAETLYGNAIDQLLEEAQEHETLSGPLDFADQLMDFAALRDPSQDVAQLAMLQEACPGYSLGHRISELMPNKLTLPADGTFADFYRNLVHMAGSHSVASNLLVQHGIPGARVTMCHPDMPEADEECAVIWAFDQLRIRQHHVDLSTIDYRFPHRMVP